MSKTGAALGLFHFNVSYSAGDVSSYHRYCVHAICPFLRTIDSDPRLRVTFEISGTGLEFLATHYPDTLKLLRQLIDKGQIELISSTYAPTFWVAFPLRDLMRSIAINKRLLASLDLKAADIFFAQEALFGYGLKAISDEFPVAVCKDDYIKCLTNGDAGHPMVRMGSLDVIVGANHLACELRKNINHNLCFGEHISLFHRERIAAASDQIPRSSSAAISGIACDVAWYWYHMGNGHHFSTFAQPDNHCLFFPDSNWSMLNQRVMHNLVANGYALTHISELHSMLADGQVVELTSAYEGGWKPERSQGVYTWMGRHANAWENDSKLLGLVWRSRRAIRRLEDALVNSEDAEIVRSLQSEVDELWKHQIMCEASDPLGWEPSAAEVEFGATSSEKVLLSALRLLDKARSDQNDDLLAALGARAAMSTLADMSPCLLPVVRAIGESARIESYHVANNLVVIEIAFEMREGRSGIQFLSDRSSLVYCPSGMEQQTQKIDLGALRVEELFLPLANGLLSLSPHQHLIRVNVLGQPAVRIRKDSEWIDFAITGPPNGISYQWQFVLFVGAINEAVRLANEVNYI